MEAESFITSRDKGVLEKCGVKNIYEAKELKHDEALELLRRKAFRENNRSYDLMELSEEAVSYAHGNPLALEVLGSSLYQKSKQQWNVKLQNLKLISEPNIYNVLKISYYELNLEEKKTFLDIACFFKGEDINFVRKNKMILHYWTLSLISHSLQYYMMWCKCIICCRKWVKRLFAKNLSTNVAGCGIIGTSIMY